MIRECLGSVKAYSLNRCRERGTWIGIAAALTGGIATMSGYFTAVELHWLSRAAIACGVIAAIVPTPNPSPGGPS